MTDKLAAALYTAVRDKGVTPETLPILYSRYYLPLVIARDNVTDYAAYVRSRFWIGMTSRNRPKDCGYIILDDVDGCLLVSTSDEVSISRDTVAFWKVHNLHDAYRMVPPDVTREYDVASAIDEYIIR